MTSDLLEENQELRKRNTELQEEISELRNNGFTVSAMTEQQLKVALEKGEQLEKENAELKEQNETKDIQIKELQEQKCYWKESSFDWRHKFFKLDKVKRLIKKDKELAKAKDLLKWALHSDPEHDGDFEKKWEEAKQFLNSEVEK